MYADDDLLMISALQHLAFCERQCALIHLEQQWAENRLTVLGELLHERVHSAESETRGEVRTVRTLRLASYTLGLTGQADVVEFHRTEDPTTGTPLESCDGLWMPFPVEYKKGKPKSDRIDEVQLCAQALCLEEQLSISISEGAIFYGEKRRRHPVMFKHELRDKTITLSRKLHKLMASGKTPPAKFEPKCKSCSLYELCQPKWSGIIKRQRYEALLFAEDE